MAERQVQDRVNQSNESIQALASTWCGHFSAAFDAMSGEQPVLKVIPPGQHSGEGMVWWKQSFDAAPGSTVWIGTPGEVCKALGERILAAAGVEAESPTEIADSYLEIVRQSLGTFATTIGSKIGRDVVCVTGGEEPPPLELTAGCGITIGQPAENWPPMEFLLNKEMLQATSGRNDAPTAVASYPAVAPEEEHPLTSRAASTLNLLMDVELPISVSFGRTRVRIQEILRLITGSIIELDRSIAEPVEVIVNNCVVARGEVVVIDGNYGVRINEVMSRKDRLQESRRSLLPRARTHQSVQHQ